MRVRKGMIAAALGATALGSACSDPPAGPVAVSAIGRAPALRNPNLEPLDPPSAMLAYSVAQGLVRFDAAGNIEPALAQSWIVSNDGLRYTFRIQRTGWADGKPVTAEQVAGRLRAATGSASKNELKPLLGAIEDIEAMTENVLEISLKAPRPNFLQLLAQPDMAVIRREIGTGPYRAERQGSGALLLRLPAEELEEMEEPEGDAGGRDVLLRGEAAALAVARFRRGGADLVTGGTLGDLPIVRAAAIGGDLLRFDPVAGLFGVAFNSNEGPVADPQLRQALAMAVDRAALVAALGVPGLQARETLLPQGLEEVPAPAAPDWAASPIEVRRGRAAQIVRDAGLEGRQIRMAVPEGPGYRLVFAHLRRDWRAIGLDAVAVPVSKQAELKLVDKVAPAMMPTWYLRQFVCGASIVCSPEADGVLTAARLTRNPAERQALLQEADRLLAAAMPFVPIAAPVRWSLAAPRLTGFQPNPFGRRFIGGLVEARR